MKAEAHDGESQFLWPWKVEKYAEGTAHLEGSQRLSWWADRKDLTFFKIIGSYLTGERQVTLGKRNYLKVFQNRKSLGKVAIRGGEQGQGRLFYSYFLGLFIFIKLPHIRRHGLWHRGGEGGLLTNGLRHLGCAWLCQWPAGEQGICLCVSFPTCQMDGVLSC